VALARGRSHPATKMSKLSRDRVWSLSMGLTEEDHAIAPEACIHRRKKVYAGFLARQ